MPDETDEPPFWLSPRPFLEPDLPPEPPDRMTEPPTPRSFRLTAGERGALSCQKGASPLPTML